MSEQCFPTHPSTNSSHRKLRLKILTSDGKRFICPVSYQCTIEQLADRILRVYTQFQRDPTHKYHASEERLAKRVYNIRSQSYYLGRTDYVGDLLNDLDEIECDVEENRGREKGKGKEERKDKGNVNGNESENRKNKRKQKREKSWEKNKEMRKQEILEKIKINLKQKQKEKEKSTNQKHQKSVEKQIKPVHSPSLPPKSPLITSRSPQTSPLDAIKKQSVDIIELQKKIQQPKHLPQFSLEQKKNQQKHSSGTQSNMRKSMSPKITPMQSDKIDKFSLNKDILSQKKKNKEIVIKPNLGKEITPKDSTTKPLKQPVPSSRNDSAQKQDKNKIPVELLEEPQSRRKKSLVVIESDEEKEENSSFANLYNKTNLEENARKIFNRFDDDDDESD